MKEKKKKQEK